MKNLFFSLILTPVFAFTPILALFPFAASADELILPPGLFRALGYEPVTYTRAQRLTPDLPLGLPWPVSFVDGAHNVAQNYVNFQDYGDGAYFHGGCDLRTEGGSDVVAATSGRLEGGYYGYSLSPEGTLQKQWRPWNGQIRRDPYFELAIVTDDGYRFEYHHVDPQLLPASTIAALDRGNARIEAGTVIGKVNGWAFPGYDHIHYNVLRPDGVPVNPEFYSTAIADQSAPTIQGVYGVTLQGKTVVIAGGATVTESLREIIVATTESHDGDAYVQTPPFAALEFASGTTSWDFRRLLATSEGQRPDIRRVFAPSLRLPNGRSLSTWGRYGAGIFLLRLALPAGASGPFTVTVGDTMGNERVFRANLGL